MTSLLPSLRIHCLSAAHWLCSETQSPAAALGLAQRLKAHLSSGIFHLHSTAWLWHPNADMCLAQRSLSLTSPSALVCSLLSCHPLSLSNSLLGSLFPSLLLRSNKGQCQPEWRQSHLVTLLTPTTAKLLPEIPRHIACGAAGIQRDADAAARQVAARISKEKLPASTECFTKSCSDREAVNEQFITSDVLKDRTALTSKKEIKKRGLLWGEEPSEAPNWPSGSGCYVSRLSWSTLQICTLFYTSLYIQQARTQDPSWRFI